MNPAHKNSLSTMAIRLRVFCILSLLSIAIGAGRASTITFSGLPGPTDAPFTTYTEGTFTVTSVGGAWFQGLVYGNPEPSIYDGPVGSPENATVQVTDSSGLFTFSSLDYSSNNGLSTYDIMGLLGLTVEFDQKGDLLPSLPLAFGFTTLAGDFPNTNINRLLIEVFPGDGVTSINLDNVTVGSPSITPEPSTLALLATGLAVLAIARRRNRRLLLSVFTWIVYIGVSAAQTTPPPSSQQLSPDELRLRHEWRVSMAQVPAPKEGCFQSDYPNRQWREVACVPSPTLPMGPKVRPRPLTVGNGNDISAQTPTGFFISTAIGSFDSVTGVTSVHSDYGGGVTIANAYTLQLNTNFFNGGTICANPTAGCFWEQFIYENDGAGLSGGCGSCGYIQYWMFGASPCPPGWFTSGSDCFRNSTMSVSIPAQAITNLGQLSLSGAASATSDSVTVTAGGTMFMRNGNNFVGAAAGWQIAEFNVVGDALSSQAVFNSPGVQIVPRTEIIYGGTAPPICTAQGFTGETNNLNFGPMAPGMSPPGPAVFFEQSSAGGLSGCAAATTVGDTHLDTFSNLFYDFQASGDFVVAQVVQPVVPEVVAPQQLVPNFVVQARQVSGAPRWPNAAVNHAIATQMGQTTAAVCLTPLAGAPGFAPVLNVNGTNIALGDGSVFSTADVDIWRFGQVFTITDQSGNSVRAVANPTWLDVSVGLGQSQLNVIGPLANANGNVNQIATSGGIVLTAPFPFGPFYQSFAQSWRVTPQESLLSVCGEATEIGNPQIPFYAIFLDPQLYNATRAICTAAGVTGQALLDACTLDVAVIGDPTAANVYVNARQPIAVGNIFLDPNH